MALNAEQIRTRVLGNAALPIASCVVVFLLVLVVAYSPAIHGPLLFDDYPNLIQNNALNSFEVTHFDDWRSVAASGQAGPFGRPFAMLTFALQGSSSADVAHSYKLFNLILHLVIAVFVAYLGFLILLGWGYQRDLAIQLSLAAAACWVASPIHVSTVMYSVQRMTQLSTLFVVLGLCIYCRARKSWLHERPSIDEVLSMVAWIGIVLWLGILSKENAVLLLPLMVLVEATVFQGCINGKKVRAIKWLCSAGIACLLLSPFVLTLFTPNWISQGYESRSFSIEQRISVQIILLWEYVYWVLLPGTDNLVFFHDSTQSLQSVWGAKFWYSVSAWILSLLIAVVLRSKELLFALLFFLVAHYLESTVFALELVFEHRNYLPSVGLIFGVIAFCGKSSLRSLRTSFVSAILIVYVVANLASVATRANHWSSGLSLFRHAIEQQSGSTRSQYLYASELLRSRNEGLANGENELILLAQLLEARNIFRELATAEEPDLAAIVSLIDLEGKYFPEDFAEADWGGVFVDAAKSRILAAEDYSAIGALIDCYESKECNANPRLLAILDELLLSIDDHPILIAGYRSKLLKLVHGEQHSDIELYKALADRYPNNAQLYVNLIDSYAERGDFAEALIAASNLLASDRDREYLKTLSSAIQ